MSNNEADRLAEPIERDEQMQRDYIPLPGGWELQTKATVPHCACSTRRPANVTRCLSALI